MKPFKHAAAVKAVFEKYEVSVEVLGNKKGIEWLSAQPEPKPPPTSKEWLC